jgi:TRAP-type C4-dicarboxylate transport system substrate-binding protein
MWKYLKNFSDVGYALPVSLASISLTAWTGLDDAGRAVIEEAANETSERQWSALAGRLAENFARMRQNEVAIDETPPADVMAALRAAAETVVADWSNRAGPQAQRVLKDYRAR